MRILKQLLDFYINSSLHVALSVFALVKMTALLFRIALIDPCALFAFFGTIVGYNFVKYDALARSQKKQMRLQLKAITLLSFGSFLAAAYYFLQLAQKTKIIAVIFLLLTLLYTLPFFPNKRNARNWAGVKIYIVALCWVGVTLFLPIVNAGVPLSMTVGLVAVQRFVLIFVLILIFEIIDLKLDDPHLKTVPQQIGVGPTKIVGSILLLLFVGMEFLEANFNYATLFLKVGVALTVFLFLLFAHENRSKYYSSFWVESIPVLWMLILIYEIQ